MCSCALLNRWSMTRRRMPSSIGTVRTCTHHSYASFRMYRLPCCHPPLLIFFTHTHTVIDLYRIWVFIYNLCMQYRQSLSFLLYCFCECTYTRIFKYIYINICLCIIIPSYYTRMHLSTHLRTCLSVGFS